MINPIVKTIELGDGRTITLETGKLAKQADGSVMLRMGNTMLLATVCAAKDAVPVSSVMVLPSGSSIVLTIGLIIKNVLIYFSSKIRAKIGIYSSNLVRMR